MSSIKKALVVGGGIGGLSTSIALRKAGIEVDLAELQPKFDVYGVGIIQPSNALRALDALGLADQCMEHGSPYGPVKMCSSNGFKFGQAGTPPMGRLPVHNGISRRILHEILHEGVVANGVHPRMGLTVKTLDNGPDTVTVTFNDGSTGQYDLVVGSDGVYSSIRSLVMGEHKPKYTGQSVWRYAFPRPADLDTGYIHFGKKTKVGLIPMTADTDVYVRCIGGGRRPENSGIGTGAAHESLAGGIRSPHGSGGYRPDYGPQRRYLSTPRNTAYCPHPGTKTGCCSLAMPFTRPSRSWGRGQGWPLKMP